MIAKSDFFIKIASKTDHITYRKQHQYFYRLNLIIRIDPVFKGIFWYKKRM